MLSNHCRQERVGRIPSLKPFLEQTPAASWNAVGWGNGCCSLDSSWNQLVCLVLLAQLLGEPALAGLVPLGAWHSLRAPTRQQQGQNGMGAWMCPNTQPSGKAQDCSYPQPFPWDPAAQSSQGLPGDAGWEQRAGVMPLGTLAYKGLLHFKECHQKLSLNTFKFWSEE